MNFEKYLNNEKPDIGIVFGTRKINKKIISKFKHGLITKLVQQVQVKKV